MFFIELSLQNIIAIVLAVIVSQVIGMIWYSQSIGFGKRWTALVGLSGEEQNDPLFKKKMMKSLSIGVIISLISAYVLAVIINDFLILSLVDAIKLGLFLWVGFSGSAVALNYLYNPKLSMKLFLIDSGYHLLSLVAMSIVLSILIF